MGKDLNKEEIKKIMEIKLKDHLVEIEDIKIISIDLDNLIDVLLKIESQAKTNRDKLWSNKFDKYACIKNDKWYLEWKKRLANGKL